MATGKAERTRRRILDAVGPMFNERGYQATTMADVVAATGLEKGGIYNHFRSKDDLALAAYDRNADLLADLVAERVRAAPTPLAKLLALLDAFRSFAHDPPFPGGCPNLNTAVEGRRADQRLHQRARLRMSELEGLVRRQVARAVERGELSADADPDGLASFVAAAVEGALLLHQLHGDPVHVDRVIDHLERHLRSLTTGRRR